MNTFNNCKSFFLIFLVLLLLTLSTAVLAAQPPADADSPAALRDADRTPPDPGDLPALPDGIMDAVPDTKYEFERWSGDVTGRENPLTIPVAGNLNIVAHFRPAAEDPHEPNDTPETATPLNYDWPMRAEIGAHDDVEFYEDKDYFSFTAFAGDQITVDLFPEGNLAPQLTLLGPDGSVIDQQFSSFEPIQMQHSVLVSGGHYLLVEGDCREGGGGCDGPYLLHLNLLDRYEPNDTTQTATPIAAGDVLRAALADHDDVEFWADVDFYRFAGKEGDSVRIDAAALGNNLDPDCALLDAAATVLIEDKEIGVTCTLEQTLPADGPYFIRINAFCGEGGAGCQGPYSLSLVSESEPHLIFLPVAVR